MTQNAIFPFRLHSHSVFVLLFTFTRQEEWVLNGNRWQQFTRLYFTSEWQLLCIMWEKSAFEYWAKRRNSMRKSMPTFLSYFWFHIFGFRLSAGVSKSIVILQKKKYFKCHRKVNRNREFQDSNWVVFLLHRWISWKWSYSVFSLTLPISVAVSLILV